jgi:hypothetical protein
MQEVNGVVTEYIYDGGEGMTVEKVLYAKESKLFKMVTLIVWLLIKILAFAKIAR